MSEVLRDQHRNPGKSIKASIMDSAYRPLLIPETLILTKVLALFKDRVVHEAVVIDEYGTLTGLVTLHDVLEEIVGDMPGDKEDMLEAQNKFIRRTENSWLVEGLCTIDEFRSISISKKNFREKRKMITRRLAGLSHTCSAIFRKKRKKFPSAVLPLK